MTDKGIHHIGADMKPSGLDHKSLSETLGSTIRPMPDRVAMRLGGQPNRPLLDEAARVTALEESWAEMREALEVVRNEDDDILMTNAPLEYKDRKNPLVVRVRGKVDLALANAAKTERQTDGK